MHINMTKRYATRYDVIKAHTTAYILAIGIDYASHHTTGSRCQYAANLQVKETYWNAP